MKRIDCVLQNISKILSRLWKILRINKIDYHDLIFFFYTDVKNNINLLELNGLRWCNQVDTILNEMHFVDN